MFCWFQCFLQNSPSIFRLPSTNKLEHRINQGWSIYNKGQSKHYIVCVENFFLLELSIRGHDHFVENTRNVSRYNYFHHFSWKRLFSPYHHVFEHCPYICKYFQLIVKFEHSFLFQQYQFNSSNYNVNEIYNKTPRILIWL